MRRRAAGVTLSLVSIVVLIGIGLAAQSGKPESLPNPPLNVNVANTPLPVSIEGTLPVSIAGTLPVSIAGTVNVRSVDEPGRSPYAAQFDVDEATNGCFLTGGNFQHCDFPGGFPVVPAGKRLVITNMSGSARAKAGCKVADISLKTDNFGGTFSTAAYTFAVPHASLAIAEEVLFNETMLAYVNAGSAPLFSVSASCAGLVATSQVVTLFGYFIDVP